MGHNGVDQEPTFESLSSMAAKSPLPKRSNRAMKLGDLIGNSLDPALKKRGFASRDLVANWQAIAPVPYNKIAMPDKLTWPRKDSPAPEGGTLYLRCIEGYGLTLSHEGPAICAAINRYFGYLLVSKIRLSPNAFTPSSAAAPQKDVTLSPERQKLLDAELTGVEDTGLRDALSVLGKGILGKGR